MPRLLRRLTLHRARKVLRGIGATKVPKAHQDNRVLLGLRAMLDLRAPLECLVCLALLGRRVTEAMLDLRAPLECLVCLALLVRRVIRAMLGHRARRGLLFPLAPLVRRVIRAMLGRRAPRGLLDYRVRPVWLVQRATLARLPYQTRLRLKRSTYWTGMASER